MPVIFSLLDRISRTGFFFESPANLINPMMTALQKGLYGIDLAFKLNNFPADPEYNFIQMEIGDRGEEISVGIGMYKRKIIHLSVASAVSTT